MVRQINNVETSSSYLAKIKNVAADTRGDSKNDKLHVFQVPKAASNSGFDTAQQSSRLDSGDEGTVQLEVEAGLAKLSQEIKGKDDDSSLERPEELSSTIDGNADGIIDKTEMEQYLAIQANNFQEGSQSAEFLDDEAFSKLDADQNGNISKSEFSAAVEKFKEKMLDESSKDSSTEKDYVESNSKELLSAAIQSYMKIFETVNAQSPAIRNLISSYT